MCGIADRNQTGNVPPPQPICPYVEEAQAVNGFHFADSVAQKRCQPDDLVTEGVDTGRAQRDNSVALWDFDECLPVLPSVDQSEDVTAVEADRHPFLGIGFTSGDSEKHDIDRHTPGDGLQTDRGPNHRSSTIGTHHQPRTDFPFAVVVAITDATNSTVFP
jgi:hypothetical protein